MRVGQCRKVRWECVRLNWLRHRCFINKSINSVDKINMSIVRSNISNLLVINVNTPRFLLSASCRTSWVCLIAAGSPDTQTQRRSASHSVESKFTSPLMLSHFNYQRTLSAASSFTFDLLIYYAVRDQRGYIPVAGWTSRQGSWVLIKKTWCEKKKKKTWQVAQLYKKADSLLYLA